MRAKTYPREVLLLRRRLAERGREVTPAQIFEWAWRHAKTLSRCDVSTPPVWTALRVVGYAMQDGGCFEAALEGLETTP